MIEAETGSESSAGGRQPGGVPALRDYQRQAMRAIVESVMGGLGRTITVEMARQAGKNELSAQVEMFLLTMRAAGGGEAVKCAPTLRPQLQISMRRLWERIGQMGLAAIARKEPQTVSIGAARLFFLSAEPSANVVGHTASLLLEVDEAQDVDRDKFDREFRPMAATTNATTVYYGTAWDDTTLLERARQANLEAERRDGVQRHFEYDWQHVARYNPEYAAFVEGERVRLGEHHPLEHVAWTGEPHELLLPRLIDLLRNVWRVRRVAIDATGLGETSARLIATALPPLAVEAVKFTSGSKSKLGFALIAAINCGRLKSYRADGSPEHRALMREAECAKVAYRANRTMNFFVDESEGHDDALVSAALLVHASRGLQRRVATGRVA